MRRLSRRVSARGMTLVELMIIVAIVGIIAALAVVGYKRYIVASKTSEANYMISAIRVAEEHHYSDQLKYLSVSQTITSTYPRALPDKNKTGGSCRSTPPLPACSTTHAPTPSPAPRPSCTSSKVS